MPNAPQSTDAARLVAGRYALGDRLGKGGMGTVWRATDSVLKRQVAIKEVKLPPTLSDQDVDAMRNRVMREAQTAARLSHPCAVTVFDVVQENGDTFIIMELVDAPSLDRLVKEEGPLPPERVAQIGLDVLSALQVAHQQGITHRDVKPGNVMIPDGKAKLADFGIASVKGDPKLTATGLILGSPSYMAPEQASQDESGPESDLWALGGTLYYAVEGVPPFDKGQAIPTLTAVVHDDPRPMERAGDLAPAISALLVKEPADRPSPDELRSMLEGTLSGGATDTSAATALAAPAPATASTVEEDAPSPRTRPEPIAQRVRSRPPASRPTEPDSKPWLAWLGALVVLALLAAFLIPKLGADDPVADEPQAKPDNKKEQAATGEQEETEPASDEDPDEEPVAPDGFNTYEDSAVGYTISYPEGWDVAPIDTRTDFREPDTGRYLRIDYTTEPGPDAYARIEDSIEPSFASRHGGYERVQLTQTEFAGTDNAALWEYTYEGQHAYNLQFVTEDGEYGFALNFQTPEGQWEESQDLWEAFKATFVLP